MIRTDAVRPARDRLGLGLLEGKGALAVGVAVCALLTALGAQIRIPLPWTPVPLTLQTFFVPLAGAALGPVLGAGSQLLYLAVGLAGLPVFAGGAAGPAVLWGATAGYLAGFPLAAWGAGAFLRRSPGPSLPRIGLAIALGMAAIYACGAAWLVIGLHASLGQALTAGVLPFLPGDAVKAIAAAGLVRGAWRRGGFGA
jgi:biotin transport system substrate-specific component